MKRQALVLSLGLLSVAPSMSYAAAPSLQARVRKYQSNNDDDHKTLKVALLATGAALLLAGPVRHAMHDVGRDLHDVARAIATSFEAPRYVVSNRMIVNAAIAPSAQAAAAPQEAAAVPQSTLSEQSTNTYLLSINGGRGYGYGAGYNNHHPTTVVTTHPSTTTTVASNTPAVNTGISGGPQVINGHPLVEKTTVHSGGIHMLFSAHGGRR